MRLLAIKRVCYERYRDRLHVLVSCRFCFIRLSLFGQCLVNMDEGIYDPTQVTFRFVSRRQQTQELTTPHVSGTSHCLRSAIGKLSLRLTLAVGAELLCTAVPRKPD